VLERAEASEVLEQPYDREGDFVAIAQPEWVLGARRVDHDLSRLAGIRLRSHGGFSEQRVPFILSHPLSVGYAPRAKALRNFDIFEFALNGIDLGL
jgi:phosphonoacetate hydrolase